MKLSKANAELYIPDGATEAEALARTTHLAIGAHQDDLEIMALDGILRCFGQQDKWFCGVVVTDGAGSARSGVYAQYSDSEMREVRRREQKKAAYVGEYGSQFLLEHTSQEIRDPTNHVPVEDIRQILEATSPRTVYMHNPADKHPTHIAVALRVLLAIRSLPMNSRPHSLYGCEVWRDLDWMLDEDKVVFDLDSRPNLSNALVGVFDSQIAGGKRYDLATIGRRQAHATYHESHQVDASQMINFAMDLTPLIQDDSLSIKDHVLGHIDRFRTEVSANLHKFE